MNTDWVSRKTRRHLLAGLVAIAIVYVAAGLLGEPWATAVSDLGEFAVVAAAAWITFAAALTLAPGEPLRRRWLLIATGTALFAAGDGVWSYIELVLQQDPFPSLADPFYLAVYPLLGFGLLSTAFAFRAFVNVPRLLLVTCVITLIVGLLLYVSLLGQIVGDTESALLEKAVSLFYPAGDLVFLLAPALFAALAMRSMGRGRVAAPLWTVVAGVALLALTDAAFSWLDWMEAYESGSFIDVGWMLGFLLISLGASLTRDLAKAVPEPERFQRAA